MVIAVISGPVLAVQAQKWIEKWRAGRQRKLWIFKTLMATRGTPMSSDHVQALNMIDLEFSSRKSKDREVIEEWKIYLDHLCSGPRDFQDNNYQIELKTWSEKSRDCLVDDLLHKMSNALNYKVDKVHLKKGAYTPKGHSDTEFEQSVQRQSRREDNLLRRWSTIIIA